MSRPTADHSATDVQPWLIVFHIDPYGPVGLPLAADILSHPGIDPGRVYLAWRRDHHGDKHVTTAIVAINATDAALITLIFAEFEPEMMDLTDVTAEERHDAAKIVLRCVKAEWRPDQQSGASVWIPSENDNPIAEAYDAARCSDELGYGVRLDLRANAQGSFSLDIMSYPFGPADIVSFPVSAPSYPPYDLMGR